MIEINIWIRGKTVVVHDENGKELLNYENSFEQIESEHTKQDFVNMLKSFLLSCPYSPAGESDD